MNTKTQCVIDKTAQSAEGAFMKKTLLSAAVAAAGGIKRSALDLKRLSLAARLLDTHAQNVEQINYNKSYFSRAINRLQSSGINLWLVLTMIFVLPMKHHFKKRLAGFCFGVLLSVGPSIFQAGAFAVTLDSFWVHGTSASLEQPTFWTMNPRGRGAELTIPNQASGAGAWVHIAHRSLSIISLRDIGCSG